MRRPIFVSMLVSLIAFSTPALSQPPQLSEFLSSMDRAEVRISGRIRYDRSDDRFTFYDENRDIFDVTVDTGRDTRERIEKECENSGFLVSYSELCVISGTGTVEIRGSRVTISIEMVEKLSK